MFIEKQIRADRRWVSLAMMFLAVFSGHRIADGAEDGLFPISQQRIVIASSYDRAYDEATDFEPFSATVANSAFGRSGSATQSSVIHPLFFISEGTASAQRDAEVITFGAGGFSGCVIDFQVRTPQRFRFTGRVDTTGGGYDYWTQAAGYICEEFSPRLRIVDEWAESNYEGTSFPPNLTFSETGVLEPGRYEFGAHSQANIWIYPKNGSLVTGRPGSAGASYSVSFSLEGTCEAVLGNSLTVTHSGPEISATFRPNFGLTIDQAALVCGVDHFNWIQHITSMPADWTFEADGISQSLPILDPFPDATTRTVSDASAGHTELFNLHRSLNDTEPYYYDEVDELGDPLFTVTAKTGTDFLNFYDRPTVPADFLDPGEYIGFFTELVGVSSDGTLKSLSRIPGTAFIWLSDSTSIAGTPIHIATGVDETDLPEIVSGGVFGVTVVPEPATLALLAAGLGTIWLKRRRR